MKFRWIMMSLIALSLSSFVSACDQNKEHMPSPAKTPAGAEKAQDLPSTRTSEVPNPATGGTNSGASRKDSQTPPSANPSGTGGPGDKSGR